MNINTKIDAFLKPSSNSIRIRLKIEGGAIWLCQQLKVPSPSSRQLFLACRNHNMYMLLEVNGKKEDWPSFLDQVSQDASLAEPGLLNKTN